MHPLNPLQYYQFFKDFTLVAKAFLETDILTGAIVESYSYRLVMILQEMVDASYPYIGDLNQLRELLPNSSIIKKIISTTRQLQRSATNSLHPMNQRPAVLPGTIAPRITYVPKNSSIFEKSGNEIPWRGVNIKYTQNEIFVDVIERIDYIVGSSKSPLLNSHAQFNSSGSAYYDLLTVSNDRSMVVRKAHPPVSANIQGQIVFSSSLSEMPQIELILDPARHNLGIPSFHKCVDLGSWLSDHHTLEFIPPDEKFTLMEYSINLLEELGKNNFYNSTGLVEADMTTGLGIAKNMFEIRLQIKIMHTVECVDNLKLDIYLPRDYGYTIKVVRITQGSVELKESGRYEWIFDKQTPTGLSCVLRGEIRSDEQEEADVTDDPLFDATKAKVVKPRFVRLSYENKGCVPSGI
ncbi:hypothetical protein FOA43_000022 [Brettanomyces nanus]|uniref:MHD domain-containing protein n=1 Tax=Eeniella nana TaxID=13502 RepID=A0A875RVA0_EENNA|nr:uncharacterized protein FOA43_000022 [Brettanomyces nanus]QPG72721.1 hypothetical protein FOA43_000022 [Brettanomyces nanus]